MVSTDLQIVLFGGMDSSNAVFRETWVFDGSCWTRVRTSASFRVFPCHVVRRAASYRCPLRWARSTDSPLRDAWERNETDPPPPPIDIVNKMCTPMSVFAGDAMVVHIFSHRQPGREPQAPNYHGPGKGRARFSPYPTSMKGISRQALPLPRPRWAAVAVARIQIFARTVNSAQYASAILHVHS